MGDDYDWLMDLFGGGTDDFSEWVPSGDFDMPSDLDEWLPPTEGGDGLDWKFPTGGLGGAASGGAGLLQSLFGGGKGGGMDLMSLLGMLGMGYGGYKANQTSKESGQKIEQASKDANANAEKLIGGAQANFKPWIDTGTKSVDDLYAMTQGPGLAGKYGPLKPKGAAKIKGSVSLAELAGR